MTSCLLWLNTLDKEGYAVKTVNYKQIRVAKQVLEHKLGRSLNNEVTRHTCLNKSCVNPDHLIPGTTSENSIDAVKQGFIKSKITIKMVDQVFELKGAGKTHAAIGLEVGLSSTMVGDLLTFKRKAWMTTKYKK